MVKIVDKGDNFIGHHCFMRDISERKAAEKQLREVEITVIKKSPPIMRGNKEVELCLNGY